MTEANPGAPTPEAMVRTLAHAAGLPVPEAYVPGVAENLQRLLAQARLVTNVDLPVGMEPASIFRP